MSMLVLDFTRVADPEAQRQRARERIERVMAPSKELLEAVSKLDPRTGQRPVES